MPATARAPRKRHLCIMMDPDAEALLRAMIVGRTGHGALLSELVRKEARERAARPAQLERLREKSGAGEKTET